MGILGKSSRSRKEIESGISNVLVELQPMLRMEHCRLEIVTFVASSGELILRLDGECTECEVSPMTFSPAIAAHVKLRVPEVREVRISA